MNEQQGAGGELIVLKWSGDLTVRRIAELKAQLQEALKTAKSVSIEIAADAGCDLTLMQLLCSAHRSASRQGQDLVLSGEFSEQFKMVLSLAGFSRHIGCALDVCGSCLWKKIYDPTGRGANQPCGAGNERNSDS